MTDPTDELERTSDFLRDGGQPIGSTDAAERTSGRHGPIVTDELRDADPKVENDPDVDRARAFAEADDLERINSQS